MAEARSLGRASALPVSLPRTVLFAWAPAVLYMGLIWVISSLELPPMPIEHVPLKDKGVHFVEFSGLGFLVAHAAFRTWPRKHWLRLVTLAFLVTAMWGLLDEIHQAFVPGRYAEALDVVADSLGALCGALGYSLLRAVARSRRRSPS